MIGIICAIEEEVQAMCSHLNIKNEKKLWNTRLFEGCIEGKEVVIANSGVGKVNAAVTTSLLLSHYDVECIINVGVAGGLLPEQNVNDVVIAKRVIQHDFDTSPVDGDEGIGYVVSCDEKLAKLFQTCIETSEIHSWLGDIASGDAFITRDNHYPRIKKQFTTCICAEMEAGAISQTCERFNVPCLIIRTLSDVVPNEGNAVDYLSFAKQASVQAGNVCAMLLSKL